MRKLIEKTSIEIKKNSNFELSDLEKTKLVYSESIILKNVINYNKVVLEIQFENVELIPEQIIVYCFEENSTVEKELFHSFKFTVNKDINPYQIKAPEKLIIDITELTKRKFTFIERIGFYIENLNEDLVFNCNIFEKD